MKYVFTALTLTLSLSSCSPLSSYRLSPEYASTSEGNLMACDEDFLTQYNQTEFAVSEAMHETSIEEAYSMVEAFAEAFADTICEANASEGLAIFRTEEVVDRWGEKLGIFESHVFEDGTSPITD